MSSPCAFRVWFGLACWTRRGLVNRFGLVSVLLYRKIFVGGVAWETTEGRGRVNSYYWGIVLTKGAILVISKI